MKTAKQNGGSPQPERHLRDYWRVMWNGRWTVFSIFTVVVVAGTVGTLLQAPVYKSATTLEINARSRGVVGGAEFAQLGATEFGYLAEERYLNTQYQILTSRSVASLVMKRLGLYQDPVFSAADNPEKAFIGRISVNPVAQTGIVRVSVRAGAPEQAALWANTLAEVYVERNLAEATRTTEGAVDALLQRLRPLRKQLRESERQRLEFAGEHELYVAQDPQRGFQDRLALLQKDLTETEVELLAHGGLYETVQQIESSGEDFLVLPRIADDPTVRGLVDDRNRIEREMRKLLVTLKPGHFKVQEKQSELEKVEQKLSVEMQRIVGAIRTEYVLLANQQKNLESAVDETKRASLALGQKASEYDMFSAEASETRKIYDLISARIKQVQLNTNLLRNNASVLDPAIVPRGPVSPNRRLNVALSAVLGLLLGAGTVFFLDYLDNTVKTSEDVEQYLATSILALIPRKKGASEAILKESYQNLRTNLNFSSLNRTRRVILISSAGPQEGKTSTIVALARCQAAAGERVVLVDCDLRRPNIHSQLKLKRNFGLTNYLADASEEESWRKYLKKTDLPKLDVLTCGPIPPNPPELFGTDRFKSLLLELKADYDWILLDSPPVASLSDTVILASLVDMIAFVIRHRENDKEVIRRCMETVRKVNPHVVGAILNDVDMDRSHYRDYYYAGYYYYGSGESSQTKKDTRKRFLGRRKVG